MVTIYQAQTKEDFEQAHQLFTEFLTWAIDKSKELYDEDIDIDEVVDRSMAGGVNDGLYSPPNGRLLLAKDKNKLAGIGCLKQIRKGTGEIKRIYVRPGNRGKKIGYKILNQLIENAKEISCSKILLDSARFMTSAHALYKSFGFKEVDIYSETEMTEDFRDHMIYRAGLIILILFNFLSAYCHPTISQKTNLLFTDYTINAIYPGVLEYLFSNQNPIFQDEAFNGCPCSYLFFAHSFNKSSDNRVRFSRL